jgi:hypothetical protein
MAEESKIVGVVSAIENSIDSATKAIDEMNRKALDGGLTFNSLTQSIETSTRSISNLVKTVGNFGSAVTLGLDFGFISKGFSGLADIFNLVIGGANKLLSIFDSVGSGIDSVSGFSRELNSSLYESVSRFGGSFDAAKRFSDYIIQSAQDFSKAEAGFISPSDRIKAVKSMEQAGIPLSRMSEIVDSAAGRMDLLNSAFLHSGALGLDLTSYMDNLGNAITRQGLSVQDASEQMAMFGDISEDTGLRVDKVAGSLQGLSNRFSKMGVTANFGKPILQGFTNTLSSLGLGFENAIDLSEGLSNSLTKLTSDYATAFVTFQRGGLDFGGGGGALGASIGLRSELLKAKESGDQEAIANQLVGALSDTLKSFTGGQIVTVQQAADSPELQQTFYTQTQLLKDLYGITEAQDQDRTLDLLKQLETATRTGDKDLASSLSQDLKNVIDARDQTLGYEERTAKAIEGAFGELQFMNKNIIEAFRLSGAEIGNKVGSLINEGVTSQMTNIQDLNAASPEDMKYDFSGAIDKVTNITKDGYNKITEHMGDFDQMADSIINGLSGVTLTVTDPGGNSIIQELSSNFRMLADNLKEYMSKRDGSNLFGPK